MTQRQMTYSEFRKRLQVKLNSGKLDDVSFLTHFLHNPNGEVAEFYKDHAENLYKENYYEVGEFSEPELQALLPFDWDIPFKSPKRPQFTFIDLFAGIGGIRLAYQKLGGKCVFSSEWDKFARQTYEANFGEVPFGDITKINENEIPPHDILLGGFPCQPFSIAGVSKKNSLGRAHGFLDKTQGTLFFDIARIIEHHRPKAFMLENVKNLVSHDRGNTFKVIKETLEELNYVVFASVLDAKFYVPQHRERTIIVGFSKDDFESVEFSFPTPPKKRLEIQKILSSSVDPKYTLSDKLWNYLQDYKKKHQAKGNGFGFGLANLQGVSRTLSARYYKDGSEILIPQSNQNPRRLTPRECARLQGFPDDFLIPVSDNQAYKQFGNSVAVPLISSVGKRVIKVFKNATTRTAQVLQD